MRGDLVSIIEAAYRLDEDGSSWIRGILEPLARCVGDGVGLFGFVYSVSADFRVLPGDFAAVGCSEEQLRILPIAATRHDACFVRRAYVEQDIAVASSIAGWKESEGGVLAVRQGVSDVWGIHGRNPGNRGLGVFVNRRTEGTPAPADERLLVRIAAHLASAQRLRERLTLVAAAERAEAIISTEGQFLHAIGGAQSASSREELRAFALSLDRARTKLRRQDHERALGTWKGLVAARWTLVDHFESDGRRYILAQENEVDPRPAAELSARERQVLASAALGRSNKEIAYALGLADSTVRVLLARAARKLEATSRRDLIRRYEALAEAQDLCPPKG